MCVCVCVCVYTEREREREKEREILLLLLLFSCKVVSESVTSWTVAHQAPLSMEFPRQEYWSGLPFPSPGDLPDPGIKPVSLALTGIFFTTEPPEKPFDTWMFLVVFYISKFLMFERGPKSAKATVYINGVRVLYAVMQVMK